MSASAQADEVSQRVKEGAAMTPTEAQTVQDDVVRRGHWIMWFVSLENGPAVGLSPPAEAPM